MKATHFLLALVVLSCERETHHVYDRPRQLANCAWESNSYSERQGVSVSCPTDKMCVICFSHFASVTCRQFDPRETCNQLH